MIKWSIFLFVGVLTFLLIFLVSLKYTSGDFDVYYNSSQNYLAKASIYIPHGGVDEFKYSPLFALLFSPLTLVNRTLAMYIWTVLNIIFFYSIFFILFKLKQISFTETRDLLIIICLFALTGRFIFIDFRLGQVNLFLCFLMTLTMYFEINKKYFLSSIVLAFSLMIKFFPLLFVLYFILKGRFKLLAYAFLMIIIFLLLPAVYSGYSLNIKYLHDWFVLLKSTPAVLLYSFKNNSLLSFFSWNLIVKQEISNIFGYMSIKTPLTSEVYYVWGSACFVFFVSFFYDIFSGRKNDPKVDYLDYSCLFVCGLLFNPLAYLNALTFLIIPYFFILRYLFYSQFFKRYLYLCGGFILLSFFLTMLDNKIFFKNLDHFYTFLEFKPLMWVIILVYISLLLAKISLKLKS